MRLIERSTAYYTHTRLLWFRTSNSSSSSITLDVWRVRWCRHAHAEEMRQDVGVGTEAPHTLKSMTLSVDRIAIQWANPIRKNKVVGEKSSFAHPCQSSSASPALRNGKADPGMICGWNHTQPYHDNINVNHMRFS